MPTTTPTLEHRIQTRGRELYDLIADEKPDVFKKDFWTGKIMDWSMQDEAFKVEMFRFVDVFPALQRSEHVARHLREYFCRPEQDFPSALRWGIESVSPDSIAAKIIAKGISKNIEGMARQFIVGRDAKDALSSLKWFRKQGAAFTVDLLGEAVLSEVEAEQYAARYVELLETLHSESQRWSPLGSADNALDWGTTPMVNISVKASALYSQLNPAAPDASVAAAKERLRPILRRAMKNSAFVNFDMEDRHLKNLTLSIYRSIMDEEEFAGYPHTGIALQAYLRETEADAVAMVDWAADRKQPLTVRLVKGAYWDEEFMHAQQNQWPIPVWTDKAATDACFERITRILLENHEWVTTACASHNIRSIAATEEMASELGVPAERLEFQVLSGMAEPVRNALLKGGLKLRYYAPVGEMIPGMAYLVRRLLENTANESFLRQSFAEGMDVDALLSDPASVASESETAKAVIAHADGPAGAFRNEPLLDWTLEENRAAMTNGLTALRARMPIEARLHVGGEWLTGGKAIHSTNPNQPQEVVAQIQMASREQAGAAVESAKSALAAWRDTPANERAGKMFEAAEIMRRRRHELNALQVLEVGKTWDEADAETVEAIDFFEYYGREMLRFAEPQRMGQVPGEDSQLSYAPCGVALVVAPWNFPLAISTGMCAAALVAGNTVVYKPSSDSAGIGHAIAEVLAEAGLPAGVFNFIPGSGGEIGDYLVEHPDVALIAFTGSMEVGLRINRLAAQTPEGAIGVKRLICEMGGKNAIIVDNDADLDQAVAGILHSAFGFQGQKCSACSRAIVLADVHDRFMKRLLAAADSLPLGLAEKPSTQMGAVVSAGAKKGIDAYIEIAREEGEIVLERKPEDAQGHFVPLTIVTGIRPEHRIAQEEIFGPVLAVMKAGDFDEALEIANGTRFALTGAVFSRSPDNLAKARQRFEVGNLYINRGSTGAIVGRHPFGGFKMSGLGSKAGGPDYLLQFTNPRSVVENTIRRGFAPKD